MSQSKESVPSECFICKSSKDDELLYGKFYSKWRLRVHYYCLLLTSNLVQNGDTDEEGIFGFLLHDIKREVNRIQAQKCYICKGRYANISCCAKKCFRSFHTVCAIDKGCLFHFVDTFQSWCDKHLPLYDKVHHGEEDLCNICYDAMGPYNKLESVNAPCCQNGWFHRRCVAHFAQTSGYFFKCPLCNNKDDFAREMQLRGVFIPEQDAAWEMEPNAFDDQLERPSECDADPCHCRYGRKYDNGKWDLILCATCGSNCRHDLCMEVPTKNYVCSFCRPIVGAEPPAGVLALAEASRKAEAERAALDGDSSDSDEDDGGDNFCSVSVGKGRKTILLEFDGVSFAFIEGYESGIHSPSSSRSSSSQSIIGNKRRARGLRCIRSDSSDSVASEVIVRTRKRKRYVESSDSSPLLGAGRMKRKTQHKRAISPAECSDSGSEVNMFRRRRNSRRLSTSSSQMSINGEEEVVMKITLPTDCIEKLVKAQPVVKLNKLSDEQIKSLTASDTEHTSSTNSSAVFDFNYRAKLNKKLRRKSIAVFQSVSEVIRSDTDTLTDASAGKGQVHVATPTKQPYAQQFKLKLLGAKSTSRKRIGSSSDSEAEIRAKKLCSSMIEPPSKSRLSLFPALDEENTCPNSPCKVLLEDEPAQSTPVPPTQSKQRVPPVPSQTKTHSVDDSASKIHQTTLNTFFKASPSDGGGNASTGGSTSSAILSAGRSSNESKKICKNSKTPGKVRKKLTDLDTSQKNLLDYFNRC